MDQSRIRQRRGNSIPARQSRGGNGYARYPADAANMVYTLNAQGAIGDAGDADYADDGYEDESDDVWSTRPPNSTRRYQSRADVRGNGGRVPADAQATGAYRPVYGSRASNVPPRSSGTRTDMPPIPLKRRQPYLADTEEYERETNEGRRERGEYRGYKERRHQGHQRRRVHWLFYLGLAMCTMLLGWMLLTTVANWWQVTQDDWHYGRPRTYQVDQVVGHNDSAQKPSHFIAINLNRQVEVIEFPGGDATKAKIYIGPLLVGPGQYLAPVTLSFQDVNGDGKIDMIVNVQDSHFIFLNNGTSFSPTH